MSKPQTPRDAARDPLLEAIHRVLEAERAADNLLRQAREEAAARLRLAREQAQAISSRAGARISALQRAYLGKVDRDLSIQAPAAVDPQPTGAPAIGDAVAAVARRLIGRGDAVAN